MRVHPAVLALGALSLFACENHYVYAPATNTGADVAGRPASQVSIPPEAPRGDVRVATFGISELEAQGKSDEPKVQSLHLRMIVANNSAAPWTVDTRAHTRAQKLVLPDRGESGPAFASADAGTPPPLVTIPAGGKRTIDLFFPLPEDMAKASQLPAFDAVWTVQTDARPVTERIPFERLQVEPAYAGAYDWDYWGAPYWYDPLYYPHAWYGVGVPPAYFGGSIIVHRPVPFSAPPMAPPMRAPPARRVR
jgi:hypothetical protein